jgi:hypothetical protein
MPTWRRTSASRRARSPTSPPSRRKGTGAREKYSALALVGGDDLHDVGAREDVGGRGAGDGADREASADDQRRGGVHDFCTGERLVALDIYDRVEGGELGQPRHLGDSVGARRVVVARDDGLATRAAHGRRDVRVVGRDDAPVGHPEPNHVLPHPDDERAPAQEAQRLARQAGGAQARRDHGEQTHREGAGADARFTPFKLAARAAERKRARTGRGTLMSHPWWLWAGFTVFVLGVLALDLGVFHRKAHAVTTREAATWTVVWVSMAAAFGFWILQSEGKQAALEFMAGYLVEEALSVDNLFVFILVFSYFRVPEELRHRVLFWGIMGALVMRGAMIAAGAALIHRFHWIIYVFGAFLVYTGIKMAVKGGEEIDPEHNPVLRLVGASRRWTKATAGSTSSCARPGPEGTVRLDRDAAVRGARAGRDAPTSCSPSTRSRRSSASRATRSSSTRRTSSPSWGCGRCSSCSRA